MQVYKNTSGDNSGSRRDASDRPAAASSENPPVKKPSAASIFGSAKPVDTAAREREIEEKLRTKEGGDRGWLRDLSHSSEFRFVCGQ